jgi:hypothetical protein
LRPGCALQVGVADVAAADYADVDNCHSGLAFRSG